MGILIFVIFTIFGFSTIVPLSSGSSGLILSPYIKNNQRELARNLSAVDPSLFLNITSHSGFFTVDLEKNSNLFFWFFPAKEKPLNTTPWIIWLQGGPGSSSLFGLFEEIGPFQYDGVLKPQGVGQLGNLFFLAMNRNGTSFNDELSTLHLDSTPLVAGRQWSWGEEFSLLFIDNPVGAGFSFTGSDNGFVTNMDECSEHLYSALQQFLEVFPELRTAPLFLAGESYAGHYVPALASRVLHNPSVVPKLSLRTTDINLQGLIMGNPVIDRGDLWEITAAYVHFGLLGPRAPPETLRLQQEYRNAIAAGNAEKAVAKREELLNLLDKLTQQANSYNLLEDRGLDFLFNGLVNKPEVKEAIHVGSIAFSLRSSTAYDKLIPDFTFKISDKLEELLEHYRVLIYCGAFDLIAPCEASARGRRKWRWSGSSQFLEATRMPWVYNKTVAGYVQSGGGLTEALVRNSGHIVPKDQPAHALQLISHFIKNIKLPLPNNYSEKDFKTLPYEDVDQETAAYSGPNSNSGIIASAVLNVFFVVVIILGLVYWVRWKRRTETHFYSMIDNSSLNDGVLTMN